MDPMFDKVHHVAYVVANPDEAIAFFSKNFDLTLSRRWVHAASSTEFVTFKVNDFVFEFLCPAGPDSRHNQTLRERGGNTLDHVAYGVHNIEAALETLKGRGILPLGQAPNVAPTGWRVANMDPKTTMGIRVQLVDLDYPGSQIP